jgi:hypothetical protein
MAHDEASVPSQHPVLKVALAKSGVVGSSPAVNTSTPPRSIRHAITGICPIALPPAVRRALPIRFSRRRRSQVGRALDGIATADAGAVNVLASPMLNGARRLIIDRLAAKTSAPTIPIAFVISGDPLKAGVSGSCHEHEIDATSQQHLAESQTCFHRLTSADVVRN